MNWRLRKVPGQVKSLWDSLRESYWVYPLLMALTAAALATGLIDSQPDRVDASLLRLPFIHDAGPEGARAVLSVIAGSMITVTGVTFSITIVALTLAAGQFGPRLLRTFMRDRSNQAVLGTFVATFLYCLLVLQAVQEGKVPVVAITVAIALAVTSVFVLIYFIHHVASSLQVTTLIDAIAAEIEAEITAQFPATDSHSGTQHERTASAPVLEDSHAVAIPARDSGFLRVLDITHLVELAKRHDLVIDLECQPGNFVMRGQAVAQVGGAGVPGDEARDDILDCVVIGRHRSGLQDINYLTGQLTELAVRALSPGVNDPRTAATCTYRLGGVIGTLAARSMPACEHHDDEGRLRVRTLPVRFADLVADMLNPIRRYGAGDAGVTVTFFKALTSALPSPLPAASARVLAGQADEMHAAYANGKAVSAMDAEAVEAAYQACVAELATLSRQPAIPPAS